MAEDTEITITLPHTVFNVVAAKTKRSAIGKRELKGAHIEVDLTKIPAKALFSLITDAIETYVQAGLKRSDNFNPDTATVDEIKKVMQARLREKIAGKAAKKATGGGARNPVRQEARKMLKEAFERKHAASGAEDELDKKQLNADISALFKDYDKWVKAPEKHPDLEGRGKIVAGTLQVAKQRLDMAEQFAAAIEGSDVDLEPTERPTPTERVKAERKSKRGAAKSA